MQYKHPEILYVLFALLIPLFIHLFQLQRFTKVAFTNVKFLKQVEQQTRKSSRLKKWLVLLARLLAFGALIVAFAQPYFSRNNTSKDWLTAIYLDNSISMQAKGEQGTLLNRAIQDIVTHIPKQGRYALLTNTQVLTDLSGKALVEELKTTQLSPTQTPLKTILLQAHQVFDKAPDKLHKLILVSDFQNFEKESLTLANQFDFVQLESTSKINVSIDSVRTVEGTVANRVVEVLLRNSGDKEVQVSLSALHNQIILAKNTIGLTANSEKKVQLSFPKEHTDIVFSIDQDDRFSFDNVYYCSFEKASRIKLMLVSPLPSFLNRIYTEDEFDVIQTTEATIPYEKIDKQAVIVLDGIVNIPGSLQTKLVEFVSNGGNLVLIPSKDSKVEALNLFFNKLKIGQIAAKQKDSLLVTTIHFSHPVLKPVFDRKISNFQYPSVTTFFSPQLPHALPILSYENNQAFVSQIKSGLGNVFWVSSPLDKSSSNFTNAPLIVPIFYNIAKQNSIQSRLSYRVGEENKILIEKQIEKDEVLHIVNDKSDFIPVQQISSDKVVLTTTNHPGTAGFYSVENKGMPIMSLSFNPSKQESSNSFANQEVIISGNKSVRGFNNIESVFTDLAQEQAVQSYFKWFILLALLFLIIEILLLKYL